MKSGQRKQKTLVLMALLISLSGLSCYWLERHQAATTASTASSRRQSHLVERSNAHSIRKDPSPIARGFDYSSFGYRDGYVRPPESLYDFPPDTTQERAIDELDISGTSQTSAELVQELSTKSESKAELFTRVRSLGLRHPDAKIREQALVHLAELGNELAINSVIAALVDPEPGIRQVALDSLYLLGKRVPIQPLVELAARSGNAALQAQVTAFIEQFADGASISLTDGFQK